MYGLKGITVYLRVNSLNSEMPKIYEYLGIIIYFYSNEHEPIHVHGQYNDMELKAEFIVENGEITKIILKSVQNRKPLTGAQLDDFTNFVEKYANEIVIKWVDYFVYHKKIKPEKITRRIQ